MWVSGSHIWQSRPSPLSLFHKKIAFQKLLFDQLVDFTRSLGIGSSPCVFPWFEWLYFWTIGRQVLSLEPFVFFLVRPLYLLFKLCRLHFELLVGFSLQMLDPKHLKIIEVSVHVAKMILLWRRWRKIVPGDPSRTFLGNAVGRRRKRVFVTSMFLAITHIYHQPEYLRFESTFIITSSSQEE